MTTRITRRDLDQACRILNLEQGRPLEPWSKGPDGRYHANIGNIHIDGAYGGWQVQLMMTDGGGTRGLTDYHAPARETYAALRAMIAILRDAPPAYVPEAGERVAYDPAIAPHPLRVIVPAESL